jgi:hypothetical protein
MSVNIKIPNETFNFSELSLGNPTSISNGFYYSPILHNGDLYIQTSEVTSKSGFVKSGNKQHIDLIIHNGDECILEWFENLENRIKILIYQNRTEWFNETIELSDIENIFISPIRSQKSGRQFVLRSHVDSAKTSVVNMNNFKIYDINQNEISIDDIQANTKSIALLKISGIKFSSRTFQVYIEIKQLMVTTGNHIFNSCLIKASAPIDKTDISDIVYDTVPRTVTKESQQGADEEAQNFNVEVSRVELQDKTEQKAEHGIHDTTEEKVQKETQKTQPLDEVINEKHTEKVIDSKHKNKIGIEEINSNVSLEQTTNEIDEFEINMNNLEDVNMKLQQPEIEHINLYRSTLQKAKELRKQALQSHLEAQNIKAKYLLNVYSESDSDYSESEEYLE